VLYKSTYLYLLPSKWVSAIAYDVNVKQMLQVSGNFCHFAPFIVHLMFLSWKSFDCYWRVRCLCCFRSWLDVVVVSFHGWISFCVFCRSIFHCAGLYSLFHLLSATSKPFSSLSTRLAHAARLGFFAKTCYINSLLLLLLLLHSVSRKKRYPYDWWHYFTNLQHLLITVGRVRP